MESVQNSIRPLHKQVIKLDELLYKHLDPGSSQNTREKVSKLSAKEKFKLPPKLKDKIEKSLGVFKERLDHFERVVNSFVERKTKQNNAFEIQESINKRVDDLEWDRLSKRISLAQKSSERLLKTLFVFNDCQCHGLKLWLDFVLKAEESEVSGSDTKPLSYFHFLVTLSRRVYHSPSSRNGLDDAGDRMVLMEIDSVGSRSQARRYRTLEIRSGPTLIPKARTKKPGSSRSASMGSYCSLTSTTPSSFFPVVMQNGATILKSDDQVSPVKTSLPLLEIAPDPPTKAKLRKRVRFKSSASADQSSKRPHCSPVSRPQPISTEQPERGGSSSDANDSGDPASGEPCTIQNLCNLLLDLELEQTRPKMIDLGQLPDPHGYRHHLYDQESLVEKKPSEALRNLLMEEDDFYLIDGLYTAYHLACSLLQLHLPAWATKAWTSSDLMLMRTTSTQQDEDWILFAEGVHEIRRRSQGDLQHLTNEEFDEEAAHITRLGIVLLEIGQGKPLPDTLNREGELREARQLLQNERVRKRMGRSYWLVVDVCLNWKNKTGLSEDLLKEDVQRRVYDEVVHPLKIYLGVFVGKAI